MSSALPSKRRARTAFYRSHSLSLLAAAAAASVMTAQWSAAHTWDNSDGTGQWQTPQNWLENTLPTQSNPVIFPFGFPSNNISIAISGTFGECQSLTFNDAYTLTGPADLVLNNGNITVAGGVTATVNLAMLGNGGLDKLGAGTLILSGPTTNYFTGGVFVEQGVLDIDSPGRLGSAASGVTINAATLRARATTTVSHAFTLGSAASTIETNSGVTFTLSGEIGGGGTLNKTGAGTLVLSAINTYSGGTTINAGILSLGSGGDSRLGVGPAPITFNGGTLATGVNISTARNLVLNAGGGGLHVAAATSLTVTGTVTGGGILKKLGNGTLSLTNGGNSYTGNTQIFSGVLAFGSDSQLGSAGSNIVFNGGTLRPTVSLTSPRFMTVNSGTIDVGASTFTSTGSITGTGNLTKTGLGTLVFSGGFGNSNTGLTTVAQGTARLNKSSGVSIGGSLEIGEGAVVILDAAEQISSDVTINSGGQLVLNSFPETIRSVTMTTSQINGGGTITLQAGAAGGVTAAGQASTINAGINFGGSPRVFDVTQGPSHLTVNGSLTNGSLVKTGIGQLTLVGGNPNSHSSTTINDGTLILQKNAGINAAQGAITVGDGVGTDKLRIANSDQVANTASFTIASSGEVELLPAGVTEAITNVTLTGPGRVTGGAGSTLVLLGDAITNASASTATITTSVQLGGTRTFNVADGAAATDILVSGPITTGGLVKAGAGTMTLSSPSTRTGLTTIRAGTLSIGADNHLGLAGGQLNFGDFSAGTPTLATTASFSLDRAISINSPAVAGFDVAAGTSLTISTDVFGNSGLLKTGGGTLITSANLTLSGTAGTLTVDGGAFSHTAGTKLVGATLSVGNAAGSNASYALGGGSLTVSHNVAGVSSVAVGVDGAGTFLQTGGTHNVNGFNSSVVVGHGPTGVGTYTISAGTFNARRLRAGRDAGASGTVNVNGGTIIVATDLQLGLTSGATGTVNINSGSISAPAIYVGGTSVGGGGTGLLNVAGGTATTPGEARIWTTSGGTGIHLSAGTLSVGSLQTSGNPQRLTWTGGTLEFTGSNPVIGAADTLGPTVNVAAGMTLRVTGTGEYLHVAPGGALDITGGIVDLTDNDLIVDYASGDPSPEFTLRDHVKNIVNGGTSGIAFTPGDGDVVIAIADNTEWGQGEFNGLEIDDTTVIGKYTYYGDANFDGMVTSDDYVAVDVGIGVGDSWVEGDFDMSGDVTSDDYVAIDVNLGKGSPNPLGFVQLKAEMIALHTAMFGASYVEKLAIAEAEGFAALVPEPRLLGMLAMGCVWPGRRRRACSPA